VAKNAARILKELALEEERFVTTLERGEAMLEQFLAAAKKAKSGLSGRDAFTLYDTFGFPVEITQEAAAEAGVDVDMDAFAAAMDEQRKQSQAAAGSGLDLTVGNVLAEVADRVAATEFRGYDELAVEGAAVLALMGAQGAVQQAAEGDTVQVVLDRTPFYAESGGQVGDQGILTTAAGATLAVTDCTKAAGGRLFVHTATVTAGSVSVVRAKALLVVSVVPESRKRKAPSAL
jgi:alanyl-tRNA synthetase